MSRNIAFPFLTVPDSCISAEPWFLCVDGGGSTPIGDYIADWDYATELCLSRSIELNMEDVSSLLEIPSDSLEVRLIVDIGTGSGRLPRKILSTNSFKITTAFPKVDISLIPPSEHLSSFLFISTTLVLASKPSAFGKLSPTLPNSRLWQDKLVTRLDGEEPRFPIEEASFASLFGNLPEARAPWFVSWNPGDWNRDFHGAVRLYLNNDYPEIITKIQAGDSFLLQTISVDVVGQVLEKLLTETDADDIVANAPGGSLAAQAASWIKLAWPTSSLVSLKHKFESQPGIFRASIWAIAESQEEL
ncbi:hypothetical protein [Marinobacter xiaoshiensis]|uniref:SAM-dependent methyltransferase, MidA family n=1 Tax=Marinobacter xiaoshiensis TaxID=3073652 RepID=A0ABU2HCU6_9GAMM|nr:hypothetical protein [Marinobacter sp. F60267]MDS1308889.1 hypothetical protein [Marinobacter sp. F60267]